MGSKIISSKAQSKREISFEPRTLSLQYENLRPNKATISHEESRKEKERERKV
jgi:hypothetical protein